MVILRRRPSYVGLFVKHSHPMHRFRGYGAGVEIHSEVFLREPSLIIGIKCKPRTFLTRIGSLNADFSEPLTRSTFTGILCQRFQSIQQIKGPGSRFLAVSEVRIVLWVRVVVVRLGRC